VLVKPFDSVEDAPRAIPFLFLFDLTEDKFDSLRAGQKPSIPKVLIPIGGWRTRGDIQKSTDNLAASLRRVQLTQVVINNSGHNFSFGKQQILQRNPSVSSVMPGQDQRALFCKALSKGCRQDLTEGIKWGRDDSVASSLMEAARSRSSHEMASIKLRNSIQHDRIPFG